MRPTLPDQSPIDGLHLFITLSIMKSPKIAPPNSANSDHPFVKKCKFGLDSYPGTFKFKSSISIEGFRYVGCYESTPRVQHTYHTSTTHVPDKYNTRTRQVQHTYHIC